jgi:hypothetical protein
LLGHGGQPSLVNRLNGLGLSGSRVRNVLMPLHRHHRREVPLNPTEGLDLPRLGGRRERVANPGEAALLLAALPDDLRALYAVACYGGRRRRGLARPSPPSSA